MREMKHQVDFCVVGGGLAGMCAAISAARHGAKVAIMQDRPVFGGNASSEIRMWVCGARGKDTRETGIVQELMLENWYRNSEHVYSIWDSVLYEKVRFEPNITMMLNCSCNQAEMDGNRIKSIKGWQLTTETWHTVEAKIFADCSGDGILAPLSGAEYRIGREAKDEFGEQLGQDQEDKHTMGMSCLLEARELNRPVKYTPPSWAFTFKTNADLPNREHDFRRTNYWWIELGGDQDSIHDTEELRDELLKIAFGVWDHIKNQGDHGAENWSLDWVGFLPGKRESRRFIGDHILTQVDVQNEGHFDDIVAYHGWGLDDHHPGGFHYRGKPNIHPLCPSPTGIPLRSLYSFNIENLMMAGRNISASHIALSSTRVMASCAVIGQAVGTAAAVAVRHGFTPREAARQKIMEIQNRLMEDDCWIPWHERSIPELSREAELRASEGDPEPLRNGVDRPIGEVDNGWRGGPGSWVEYSFDEVKPVKMLRFVFDSDLDRTISGARVMSLYSQHPFDLAPLAPPECITKAFRIEAQDDRDEWEVVHEEMNNYQRFIRIQIEFTAKAVRFVPLETWGAPEFHLFAWDVR
ncbi:FAD-dependent oxidoreductase [bacterium]|nr:FAD-dependent oxidoreductase [bacterium]